MSARNPKRRIKTTRHVGPDEQRIHCVSVRLTSDELALLQERRGTYKQGEWLRMAALDSLPKTVPEVNADLSLRLAKLLGALGSLMQNNKLDEDKTKTLLDIRAEVVSLRMQLEGEK